MTNREMFLHGMKAKPPEPAVAVAPLADIDEIPEERRQLFERSLLRMAYTDVPFLPVRTSPRSRWYRRRCAECRHTFRVGDLAAVCPRCQLVYHWNPIHGLDCLGVVHDNDHTCRCGEPVPEPELIPDTLARPEHMASFMDGLSREWSAFGDQKPQVVTSQSGLEGRLCAVCGHTVRLREMVVRCPCGNGPDGECPGVIHLDLARQLHCWNDWHGGRGKSYCPLTGHEVRAPEVDA